MYSDLKLKLVDAHVEWEPARKMISLVGVLGDETRRWDFRYFAVTQKEAPTETRFWVVWMPIYEAVVEILESSDGSPLPSNITNRSMDFRSALSGFPQRRLNTFFCALFTFQSRFSHVSDTFQSRFRHVSVTFQTRFRHVSVTFQSRFRHVSDTFQSRFSHVSDTFQSRFSHVSDTFQSRFRHVSVTFQSRFRHVSVTFSHTDINLCAGNFQSRLISTHTMSRKDLVLNVADESQVQELQMVDPGKGLCPVAAFMHLFLSLTLGRALRDVFLDWLSGLPDAMLHSTLDHAEYVQVVTHIASPAPPTNGSGSKTCPLDIVARMEQQISRMEPAELAHIRGQFVSAAAKQAVVLEVCHVNRLPVNRVCLFFRSNPISQSISFDVSTNSPCEGLSKKTRKGRGTTNGWPRDSGKKTNAPQRSSANAMNVPQRSSAAKSRSRKSAPFSR